MDPGRRLRPLLHRWNSRWRTAENLLIQREGNSWICLNEPLARTGSNPASVDPLRSPVGTLLDPGTRPVRSLVEGTDSRGVPVMAVGRAVPGTPCLILTRIETAEALRGVIHEAQRFLAGGLSVIVVAGLGVGLLWRQRQHGLITRQLELEQARNDAAQRLGCLTQRAHDAILLFDPAMRLVEFNETARRWYGYEPDQFLRLTAPDIRAPEARPGTSTDFASASAEQGLTFETLHRRRDGSVFPVEVSSGPVVLEGRPHVISIVRDISQRRAHEAEIERLGRLYQLVSRVNQILVRTESRPLLFDAICRVLVAHAGVRAAWIHWLDPDTGTLVRAALAGDLGAAHADATDRRFADGQPACSQALRNGRTCVCNDLPGDPPPGGTRELAIRSGFQSCISLPLHVDDLVTGSLTVVASERNFFGTHETALLEEAAANVCFSLQVFDIEADQSPAAIRANLEGVQVLGGIAFETRHRHGHGHSATSASAPAPSACAAIPTSLRSGGTSPRPRRPPGN